MQGWETSLYRGKYFLHSQENYRKCVQFRESRHRYGAANKTSSARGAYQFLDSQWRESLAHMVYPELVQMYGKSTAKDIKETLVKNSINKWSRKIQDQAFYTVLNYHGKWSGKKHWNGSFAGYKC
jgi:muramidase (phage lysozyme)